MFGSLTYEHRGEPSQRTEATRRIACVAPPSPVNYPPAIERALRTSKGQVTFEVIQPHVDNIPSLVPFDLIILAGSNAHVSERTDWMRVLDERVRTALERETPVFGICFGYQFLAELLGGSVGLLSEPETGFREIRLTDAGRRSPMFDGLAERFVSFTWHWDHVTEVPPNAEVLAKNERGIHAFAATEVPVAGVQFHPECGLSLAREHFESVGEGVQVSAGDSTETLAMAARPARRIYPNLSRILSSSTSTLSPVENV